MENFKRRIGITEKSHETRRDHWGGYTNPYFDSDSLQFGFMMLHLLNGSFMMFLEWS